MSKYIVLQLFEDKLDSDRLYRVGDVYPREGLNPSTERIKELMGLNAYGKVFLQKYTVGTGEAGAPRPLNLEAEIAVARNVHDSVDDRILYDMTNMRNWFDGTIASKEEVDRVTAQLAQTMSQVEFDSWVATLLDGGPSIFMDSLAMLQSTYPTGASGVALVRETDPAKIYVWDGGVWQDFGEYQGLEAKDASITSPKIATDAVIPSKVKGVSITGGNLYWPEDHFVEDRYVNTADGTIKTASGWGLIEFPVVSESKYSVWLPTNTFQSMAVSWWDSLGNIVSFGGWGGLSSSEFYKGNRWLTLTAPENAVKVCFNARVPNNYDGKNSAIIVNETRITDEILNNGNVNKLFGFQLLDAEARLGLNEITDIFAIRGNNLYDISMFTNGYLYNSDGVLQASSSFGISDIPIVNITTHSLWLADGVYVGDIGRIVFKNQDGEIIKYVNGGSQPVGGTFRGVNYILLTPPDGTVSIGITSKRPAADHSETLILKEGLLINEQNILGRGPHKYPNSPAETLSRFTWANVGDSNTEDNSRATVKYGDIVAEKTGINQLNFGKSGTGFIREEENENAYYQRVLSIPSDTDIVTVSASLNDLGSTKTLGEVTDTTADTICGAINLTFDNIESVAPAAVIAVMGPLPWIHANTTNTPNQASAYVDKLEQICKKRSIPFQNMFYESGLRPWQSSFRTEFYKRDDGNGVHPDENAHRRFIAPKWIHLINKLLIGS